MGFVSKDGSLVATRLKSFQTTVIAYDPYISDERFKQFGVEKVAKSLGSTELASGIWSWENLESYEDYGPGYYYVGFNTSILTINEQRVFFMRPTVHYRNDLI